MVSVGIGCYVTTVLSVLIYGIGISVTAGVTTTEPDNTCASQPCLNDGTCIRLREAFVCQCARGYVGLRCEIPESEQDQSACDSQPCIHGLCHSTTPDSYTCMCYPGWKGSNCNIDHNECELANRCEEKQSCVNLIGSFECRCPSGLAGENCDKDICSVNNPCLNDGKCIRDTTDQKGYKCSCPDGYGGQNCQAERCASNICQNSGSCYKTNQSRFCECSEGYIGTFCETREIGCSSDPCQHGGSCVESSDDPNGFMCDCAIGYTGRLCDQKLQAVCYYNSHTFLHGQTRLAKCNQCHCKFGSWLCTTKFCGTIEVVFDFTEDFSLLTGRTAKFKDALELHIAESVNIKRHVIQDMQITAGSIHVEFILVALADADINIEDTAADVLYLLDSGNFIFPFEGHAFHLDVTSVKLVKHDLSDDNQSYDRPVVTHSLLVTVCVVVTVTLVLAVIAGLIAIFVKRNKSEKTAVGQFSTEISMNNTRHHNNLTNTIYNSVHDSEDDESEASETTAKEKDVNIYKTADFCY